MRRLAICAPSHALHGGVETIVNDLCGELPRRGWDVVLGLARGARFNDPARYRDAHPGLPVVDIDGRAGTRQARHEALVSFIARTTPDVVLSARLFDAYDAVDSVKGPRGPRLAVMVRAYEPEYLFDARRHRGAIDLCVADGRLLAAACVELSQLSPERVADIPGGIRPPVVPAAPRTVNGPIRIGYVGRLEQAQKRVLDLVPFLSALDGAEAEYTLDVIGAGPASGELSLALAPWTERGVARIRGWQSADALYETIYPALDCLVHFAHTEGVTIVPREAMVHGVVPVISEFVGLHAEGIFRDEVNALTFAVGDTARAASQVVRLATETALLTRLSRNAMESQSGRYGHDGSMDAWAAALDATMVRPPLVGGGPPPERADSGRLARLGVSPWLAQRARDLLRVRVEHGDPGSEWPTGSGTMSPADAAEIASFADEFERRSSEARVVA